MTEVPTVGGAQSAPPRPFYSRQASGLVKDIGFWSNIALSLSFMAIPFFVLSATAVPASFPGADPFWSSVIGAVICIIPAILFAYFLVVMPRTGGDYVFISRSIHPWVGFISNFSLAVWILLGAGYVGDLAAGDGLSPAFASIGTLTNNHTLMTWSADLTTKGWGFAAGAFTLLLSAGMMMISTRRMLQIMKVILVLSLLGLVASFFVLLFNTRSDFVAAVSRYGGNYHKIIADAQKAGYAGGTPITFSATIVGVSVAAVAFLYPFLGVYGGSELRSAKTSGRRAIYGALAVAVVLTLPVMFLADRVMGVNFLGSATFLASSKSYPFTAPPFYFFFVTMLTSHTWLIVVINASVTISLIALGPPSLFMCSRSLFAWAFDRVVPTKLSEINSRTHAPVLASLVLLVVGIAVLAISVFAARTLLSLVFTAILAQLISFVVLGIAGMVFPYRRRDLYADSPIAKSFLGIPVMSIVAAASTAFFGVLIYWYATKSILGANTRTGWISIAVIFVVGFAIYPISKWVNRERGIDLGASFRSLPPD
jgi:basic amino acid/polyamine antiporter, APA family